jgi:hypothetical protein
MAVYWSCTVCGHIADHGKAGDCSECGYCLRAGCEGVTCTICGERTRGADLAEVIYKVTGARGLAHAECYLADTCCYSLA